MPLTFSTNFRKNIISFAWAWLGLLIFIGIMSLFSIWSMNRAYNDGAKIAFNNSRLKTEMLSAQIHFKIQVQEWKNILLRGKNSTDRVKYFAGFQEEETSVTNHLEEAKKNCLALNLNTLCKAIEKIGFEHQELGRVYKENLKNGSLENYEGIHKIDQNVRGIDRTLENNIDTIYESIADIEKNQLFITKQGLENRYLILRKLIIFIMLFAISISAISLYSILRSTKN